MKNEDTAREDLIAEERERFQTILRAAVECLPFGFFALGDKGRYILDNAANRALWGEIVGKLPSEVAPDAKTLSIWLDNNRRVLQGERIEGEVEFTVKGETRSYYNVVAPIRKGEQILGIFGVNIDITDRKRTEDALRVSEERFQAFMSNAPSFAWMKDEQGRHVYRNKSAENRLGWRREDWFGKTDFELWPRQIAEQLRKNDLAVLASGRAVEVIEEITAPDGSLRHLWVCKFPFQNASGERYVGGVGVDITDRLRAEDALKRAHDELERRVLERTAELSAVNEQLRVFQIFADAAGQGFGMAELDGRITYVNPTMCRFLGESRPQDAVGKPVMAYYPADYVRKREEEVLPALGRNGHWYGEHVLLSHHGKATPVLQSSFLMRDENGAPFRVATVFTDISDRKRAEEDLRQSHDHLQTIYEGIIEGLLITDIETKRFVRVNSAACRMLGYTEEELLAASIEDIHPPEEIFNDLERFHAVAEGRVSIHEDRAILRKDGSIFYADIVGHPIVYGGRPCTLALVRDVTERKRAREFLERQRRTLERLFRSSDHERQLIAYEIHDGLAQYLAGAIMQFDAFAHRKDAEPKDAKAFEAGMMMLRQGHAEARRLISGVRPPILDEEGIVAAVAHLIHEQRAPGGPKIEFHGLVDFDRLVSIQENTIYRIVQEGLTNACEHSKSQRIRVELVQQGDAVRIVVQDWGLGFDPSRIGENCYGLEGIRERARLLGGQSSVESAPGMGTRLTVELPLVIRDRAASG